MIFAEVLAGQRFVFQQALARRSQFGMLLQQDAVASS